MLWSDKIYWNLEDLDVFWAAREKNSKPRSIYALPAIIFLVLVVIFFRCTLLSRRISRNPHYAVESCEASMITNCNTTPGGPDAVVGSSGQAERSFPTSARYIGAPANLDKITRIIRKSCPMRLAICSGKCGLCGQDIYAQDSIRSLPCTHSYHNLCVLRWFVLSRLNCPDCHQELPH